ncbi:MAG: hypothetical protein R2838_00965 [Caldilineaceae bacterium]
MRAVEPELRQELPQMARTLADDLYAEWLDFKRQYRHCSPWPTPTRSLPPSSPRRTT